VSLTTTFAGGNAGVREVVQLSRSQASPWSRSLGWKSSRAPSDGQPALDTSTRPELPSSTSPG
jgi:hypothetical protein